MQHTLPANDRNQFIGDDLHGIVDIQEGYYFVNMTDVHVLISEYQRWIDIYKESRELRRVFDEWYYWSLENHDPRKDEWISVEERKPDFHTPVFIQEKGKDYIALRTENRRAEWYNIKERRPVHGSVTQWKPIINTSIKPRYCNLKNWLLGWRPNGESSKEYKAMMEAELQKSKKKVRRLKKELKEEANRINNDTQF